MATVIKRNRWQIWRDVIFALFVREIRTNFNDKFGIAWSVVSPLAFIFILSFIRGRMSGEDIHTVPTFAFMVYGLLNIQFFLETLQNTSMAIQKNKALFAFRQVQPISSILATGLFSFLVKLTVYLFVLIVMYFIGIEIRVDNPLMLFFVFVLLWILAVSVGCLLAVAKLYVREIAKVQSLATRPLFFISGTFFSLQDMPQEYWVYFNWNPILQAIELSRFAAYESYGTNGVSIIYLVGVTLTTLCLSLAFYYSNWKQAISQ